MVYIFFVNKSYNVCYHLSNQISDKHKILYINLDDTKTIYSSTTCLTFWAEISRNFLQVKDYYFNLFLILIKQRIFKIQSRPSKISHICKKTLRNLWATCMQTFIFSKLWLKNATKNMKYFVCENLSNLCTNAVWIKWPNHKGWNILNFLS